MRRLESLLEMRVMEENRLSSIITVAVVRESVEEHLTHLNDQIKRTEKLIRNHIKGHPRLKRQSQLLDSIPGIAETTAALLLAEITDITQYRSARQVAAYAGLVPRERPIRDECQRADEAVKDRQCAAQASVILSGDHGAAVQPILPSLGEGLARARQVQDECHLRGDAEAGACGLRGVEEWQSIRPGVDENCLTTNTVSNRAGNS